MQTLHPKMKDVFPKFALKELSTFTAVIVIFIYNFVLQVNMKCSCEEQVHYCNVYMAVPCFCLFFLHLWTDRIFRRACRYTCSFKSGCRFCIAFGLHFFKAAFVGSLWAVSVFIDGDWYVCCMNNKSTEQASLACKKKDDFTAKDHKNNAELKNKSFTIGIWILVAFLFVAASISLIEQGIKQNIVYEKLILDEEEKVLKEVLTAEAKNQLTAEIKGKISMNDWREFHYVAERLRNTAAEAAATAAAKDAAAAKAAATVKAAAEAEAAEAEAKAAKAATKAEEEAIAAAEAAAEAATEAAKAAAVAVKAEAAKAAKAAAKATTAATAAAAMNITKTTTGAKTKFEMKDMPSGAPNPEEESLLPDQQPSGSTNF